MNITKEGEGLEAVIKIQLIAEDYADGVQAALKDYRKKAKIDGFRPGTVPMGLVKKMYGKYVLVDAVNRLLSENLQNYIKENNLKVLGEPLPSEEQKEVDWDNDTEFEFSFDIAVAPEVNISLSKKNKADYYKIIVDDKMIDEQVDQLASRYGSQEMVDDIKDNDMLRGNLKQVGAEEPYSKEGASMLLAKIAAQTEMDTFLKAKKGDTVTFNPKAAFDNETEIAAMLGVDKENADLINADYEYEITSVMRFKKAEVNQELFDKVYGEGVINSEEELRSKIKTDAESRLAINGDYEFFYNFKNKLVEDNKFELPETFLKRWIIESNKDNDKITSQQIEDEFPLFLEDLKWQIISGQIVQDNDIKVESAEIIEAAKNYTRMQFAQFGMMNVPDEDVEKWSQEILKNKEEVNKLFETEMQNKIIAYLKETIKLNEKEISLEDFNKLMEKK